MLSIPGRRHQAQPTFQGKYTRFSEPKKDKTKEKKYVSTSAIFKINPSRVRKTTNASRSGKNLDLGKSILRSRRHSSSSSPPPRPRKRSLASISNDALNDYRSQVINSSEQTLSKVYKHLVQRLEPQNLNFDALPVRIKQVTQSAAKFTAPLAEQTVKVHYRDANGNKTPAQNIPIGDTITRFQDKFAQRKRELEKLWEEWDQLQQEIAGLGAQILRDAEFPVKFGFEAVFLRADPSSPLDQNIQELRMRIEQGSNKTRKEAEQEVEDTKKAHKKEKSALAAYFAKMAE